MGLKGLCLDCQQSGITEGRFKLKEYCQAGGGKVERNSGDGWGISGVNRSGSVFIPTSCGAIFSIGFKGVYSFSGSHDGWSDCVDI